jgi:hypothetical protein
MGTEQRAEDARDDRLKIEGKVLMLEIGTY